MADADADAEADTIAAVADDCTIEVDAAWECIACEVDAMSSKCTSEGTYSSSIDAPALASEAASSAASSSECRLRSSAIASVTASMMTASISAAST